MPDPLLELAGESIAREHGYPPGSLVESINPLNGHRAPVGELVRSIRPLEPLGGSHEGMLDGFFGRGDQAPADFRGPTPAAPPPWPPARTVPYRTPSEPPTPVGPATEKPGLLKRMGRSLVETLTGGPPKKTREEQIAERAFAAQAEIEAREHPYFAQLESEEGKRRFLNVFRRGYGLEPLTQLPGPETFTQVTSREFGTVRGLVEKLPYVEHALTGAELVKVHRALGRTTRGEGTADDFEVLTGLQERIARESRGKTWGGTVASIPAESIPFMGELALGGGVGRLVAKGAKAAAARVGGKTLSKAAAEALTKLAAKGATQTIPRVLTHAAAETVQRGIPTIALQTGVDTVRRMLPRYQVQPGDDEALAAAVTESGQPFMGALRDSSINAVIQVYSEYTGKALGIAATNVGRAGMALAKWGAKLPVARVIAVPLERSGEWIARTRTALAAELVNRFPGKYATFQVAWAHLREVGVNNAFEEIGEERVATLMESTAKATIEAAGGASTLQQQPIWPGWNQLSAEFAGFMLPPGAALGAAALAPEPKRLRQIAEMAKDAFRETPRPRPAPPPPGTEEIPPVSATYFPPPPPVAGVQQERTISKATEYLLPDVEETTGAPELPSEGGVPPRGAGVRPPAPSPAMPPSGAESLVQTIPAQGERDAVEEGMRPQDRFEERPGDEKGLAPAGPGGGRGAERLPTEAQEKEISPETGTEAQRHRGTEISLPSSRRIRVRAEDLNPGDRIPGLARTPVVVDSVETTPEGARVTDVHGWEWDLEKRDFYVDRPETPRETEEAIRETEGAIPETEGAIRETSREEVGLRPPPGTAPDDQGAGTGEAGAVGVAGVTKKVDAAGDTGPVASAIVRLAGGFVRSLRPDEQVSDADAMASHEPWAEAMYNVLTAPRFADLPEKMRSLLYPQNRKTRALYERLTGRKLPRSLRATIRFLEELPPALPDSGQLHAALNQWEGITQTAAQSSTKSPKPTTIKQETDLERPTEQPVERRRGEEPAEQPGAGGGARAEGQPAEAAPGAEGGGPRAPVGVGETARGGKGDRGAGVQGGAGRGSLRTGGEPVSRPARGAVGVEGAEEKLPAHTAEKGGLTDYVVRDPDDLFAAGKNPAKTIFRRNVEAIRLVKRLKEEGRAATAKERDILSRYQGWGSVPQPFDPGAAWDRATGWHDDYETLEELLSDEEWKAARQSTQNAMYTPPAIISALWETLERMGFSGGAVLEPSAGVGHFLGLQPLHLADASRRVAVEKDDTSAAILHALYPASDIRHSPFENALLPKNYFDVAVGNVPFGDLLIHDRRYPKWLRRRIHDYFFVRALDLVRPGGLAVFISSKGSMDKLDGRVRAYIAARADLLGAVRLNEDSLPGTKVTADILFLRKRAEGEPAGGEAWLESKPYAALPGKHINEYFQTHPEMVLGEIKPGSRHAGGEEGATATIVAAREGFDLATDLRAALATLPGDVFGRREAELATLDTIAASIPTPDGLPQGTYFVREGQLRRAGRKGEASEEVESSIRADRGDKAVERLKGLIGLRDRLLELLRASIDPAGDERLPGLQKSLNDEYDRLGRRGVTPIHASANAELLADDPLTLSLLGSIEEYDRKTKKAAKGDVFTRRILEAYRRPTSAATAADALSISLDEFNRIDLRRIAELLNTDEDGARGRLIREGAAFPLPAGEVVSTADYLSGNVRAKLEEARALLKVDKATYQGNVDALVAVQPADLPASRIRAVLGAPWIPAETIEDFLVSLIGQGAARSVSVRRSPATGRWTVSAPHYANDRWGTRDYSPGELLADALNMKTPKVTDKTPDGAVFTDQAASDAARSKLEEIRAHFETWIWSHAHWGPKLLADYNEQHHNWVPTKYDGGHLTLPGSNPSITLRGYQKDGVYRVLSSPHNTLIYTAVGGGKTFTATAAAMEVIRLGLARKVVVVVARKTLNQFIKQARQLYPGGRFVALSTKDLAGKARGRTLARVALAEKTVFILPHEQFKALPVSEATLEEFYGEAISDLEDAIGEGAKDDSKAGKRSVKQMEKMRDNLRAQLQDRVGAVRKLDVLPFEELGLDWIIYDEAHKGKNLQYTTQMENIRGLGPREGNQITLDLYMKARYVSRLQNGRGVTFLTGTPVNNSISEIYAMMRYLIPDVLKSEQIASFDDWVRWFAVGAPDLERVAGRYKMVTRLRRFQNLRGLHALWDKIAHPTPQEELDRVLLSKEGGVPVVRENSEGKRTFELVVLPVSAAQRKYQKVIAGRVEAIRARGGRPPQPGDDIMLTVIGDEKKAALDMRLIYPDLPEEPGGKLAAAAEKVIEIYKETAAERLTQMVFLDLGNPGSRMPFSTYQDFIGKLVAGGVAARDIATIYDAKDNDAAVEALLAAFNRGDIRVLIGSKKKMGEGINAQERAVALHQLEPAWEPGTLTQMVGRVVRSGNRNREVRLYRYVTKGMSDEFMYSLLAAKQKVNNDFLSGRIDADEIEDVDLHTMAFQMAMAESSENKAVLEWTKAEHELRRLQGEARYHRDTQLALRSKEALLKSEAGRLAALIAPGRKFVEWVAKLEPAVPFVMQVGQETYQRHGEAGTALFKASAAFQEKETRTVGAFRGLRVTLARDIAWASREQRLALGIEFPPDAAAHEKFAKDVGLPLRRVLTWSASQEPTAGQLRSWVTGFAHALDEVTGEGWARDLAQNKEKLAEVRTEIGRPFARQEEMERLAARVSAMSNQIAAAAEQNANQGDGHVAELGAEDADVEEPREGGEGEGGGAAGDTPWFGPRQESLLPEHLTPEEREWMRQNWHRPLLGMGAMSGGMPGPTTVRQKLWSAYARNWDRIAARLKHMKTPAGQRYMDSIARLLWGAEWKIEGNREFLLDDLRGGKGTQRRLAEDMAGALAGVLSEKRATQIGKPWPPDAWQMIRQTAIAVMEGGHRSPDTLPRDIAEAWDQHVKPLRDAEGETVPRRISPLLGREEHDEALGRQMAVVDEALTAARKTGRYVVRRMPLTAWDAFTATEHRLLIDVARGKRDWGLLSDDLKAWVAAYKSASNALTDEILKDPMLLKAAKSGGLVNWEQIVRMRRESGRAFLTSRYHMHRDDAGEHSFGPLTFSTELAAPRIPIGMLREKRADNLWTVTLARGQVMQFSDEQSAIEFAENERLRWHEYFGESVKERVRVKKPFSAKQVEWLGPVEDIGLLAVASLTHMRAFIDGVRVFHQLAQTEAMEEVAYLELPEEEKHHWRRLDANPGLGPLADKYVSEELFYNLNEFRLTMNGLLAGSWRALLTAFRSAHVVYNPATWFRQIYGQHYFWTLLGMNPYTHRDLFIDAFRRVLGGLEDSTYRRLSRMNAMHGGYDREKLRKSILPMLDTPTTDVMAVLARLVEAAKEGARIAGRGYGLLDEVSVMAVWIHDVEQQGHPESFARDRFKYLQNYSKLGIAARFLRNFPLGDPFVAFSDQALKITAKGMREHPGRVLAFYAFPYVLNAVTRLVFGVTDDEMAILNTDRQRHTWADRYFQPVAFRDGRGRVRTLDLRWIFPLANDFRVATGPGGFGVPFLLNQPLARPLLEVMFNRSEWTGRDLSSSSEGLALWEAASHVAWQSAPIPSLGQRGALRLYRAVRGESDEEFIPVLLKEVFGISITRRYATKAEAYRLVRRALGEQAAQRAGRLIEYYNRYRWERAGPITRSGVESSIRSAARSRSAAAPVVAGPRR